MSHQAGRVIYDADSHIIEGRGWLESYATQYVRENLDKGVFDLDMPALDPIIAAADKRLAGDDPELTEALKSDIFAHPGKRNMWSAYGAVEKKERSDALGIMGISSQLIFHQLAQAFCPFKRLRCCVWRLRCAEPGHGRLLRRRSAVALGGLLVIA